MFGNNADIYDWAVSDIVFLNTIIVFRIMQYTVTLILYVVLRDNSSKLMKLPKEMFPYSSCNECDAFNHNAWRGKGSYRCVAYSKTMVIAC